MQVQFKIPVTLSGVTYGKGQHDVPVEATKGWFFDALIKDGNALVLRDEKAADVKPVKKKKKIAKKTDEDVNQADLFNLTVEDEKPADETVKDD